MKGKCGRYNISSVFSFILLLFDSGATRAPGIPAATLPFVRESFDNWRKCIWYTHSVKMLSEQRPEFSLFPAPPSNRKRSSSKKRSASGTRRSASRSRTPLEDRITSPVVHVDGAQSAGRGRQMSGTQDVEQQVWPGTDERHLQHNIQAQPSHITVPPPIAQPHRSQATQRSAPTLPIRTSSQPQSQSQQVSQHLKEEPTSHSMFPLYDPEVPLEYQSYYPTASASSPPSQMPSLALNRRPYSPELEVERPPNGFQSPMPVGLRPGLFPRGLHDETILEPSSHEDIKQLWKVCNGWRVSPSEGRRFCLRINSAPEEPVHTLSSATSPLYTLRLDPTSTSAIVTLSRADPNKPASKSAPLLSSLTSSPPFNRKDLGQEVLTTTLEESSRRLPPNDGLIALLYPRAASNMAIELATKAARQPYSTPQDSEAVIEAAERECGRLVWDYDSKKYYLVHPSLSTPFYISIHTSPAWSRSEYTLEHPELPRNLIRLVRDGSGGGFMEIDTAVAGRLECFYIVDVAITAILLVCVSEEKSTVHERFDAPPPSIFSPSISSPHLYSSPPKKTKPKFSLHKSSKDAVKIQEFEIDLESQDSLSEIKRRKQKKTKVKKEDKTPGCCGLLWMIVKFFAWIVGLFFIGLGKVVMFICRGCHLKRDKATA